MTKAQLKTMTNKKQRQEWKQAKKALQRKTETERAREVQDIRERLAQLEIDDKFGAVRELFTALDHFVATGDTVSGTIVFPECPPYGRNIVYHFTNIKGTKGTCDLIVDSEKQLEREAEEAARAALKDDDENVGSFQKELEEAIISGKLFPQGVGQPDVTKVIESLLAQAKQPQPMATASASVEILE